MKKPSHADHLESVPPDVRLRLEAIQAEVERRVPEAERCVGYGMPAYRQGRIFLYFAAFRKHIGIYPPVTEDEDIIHRTAAHRGSKGNLSFALHEPLPLALIGDVAAALARQYGSGEAKTQRRKLKTAQAIPKVRRGESSP